MNDLIHIPFHGGEVLAVEENGKPRISERFVYVVEFSSGTVKVGQTGTPAKRLADHANAARAHGGSIVRSWVSGPHKGYEANESELIAFCASRWEAVVGKEYFGGADYDRVVAFAQTLPQPRLTAADVARSAAAMAEVPSLVAAVEAAYEAAAEAAEIAEGGADCAWYVQFKESQAWFAAEYPEGGYAPVDVGRRAWAALSGGERRLTLDLFFVDYFIALREEEDEERVAHESGAYAAELEALRAALPVKRGES